jgi:flagellar hook-associated protein 2
VNDAAGARLALVSQTTGQPGDLTIAENTTGLSFTKSAAGTNASLSIDNVPITSTSNTVSGALPGVILQLIGQSATPLQLDVAADTSGIKQAISDFVDSYNAATSAVNVQYKVDPNTYVAGELASDATLRSVQASLLSDVTYSISGNGGITGLASIGVNMQDDGTLTIDDTKLSSVISNDLPQVQNFFQSVSPHGFGSNFATALTQMTSTGGPIRSDLAQIAKTQKTLADQISALEDQLAIKQKLLINQYSQVNAALQEFPLIMQQITGQLSSLSNNGRQ